MNDVSVPAGTLNLIGAGRVGSTLARLWQRHGPLRVQAVLTRGPSSAAAALQRLGLGPGAASPTCSAMPAADVWLLAVPDDQIAVVARELAASAQPPAIAWHASGFLPAAEAQPLRDAGWAVASVHPALSFADIDSACAQFPGTLCALEGDAPAVARARAAMAAIGGDCFELAAEAKPLYHGAAVLASNFLPVLQAVAEELWRGSGLPAAQAAALAHGFVQRSASNLARMGPAAALTGPAARGDDRVLQAQGAAMTARDPALGQAYAALSQLAGRLARQGHCLDEPPAPRT